MWQLLGAVLVSNMYKSHVPIQQKSLTQTQNSSIRDHIQAVFLFFRIVKAGKDGVGMEEMESVYQHSNADIINALRPMIEFGKIRCSCGLVFM